LHERLLKALDNNSKIFLDASAVSVADTASLQLLLILKRTAIKLQKEVVIDFPSDRFIEAADLLGISEMLEVDQAAAGLF
jgi:anti-anti-sigma regulatory factor